MYMKGYRFVRRLIEDRRRRHFVNALKRTNFVVSNRVVTGIIGKLESILDDNIVPFWFPDCLDEGAGGYLCDHGLSGSWQPMPEKSIVGQSRILWFASRLINFGRTSEDNIRWAEHGFTFLRDRLWDFEHGGFYWEVETSSGQPTKADKHLYGQAFALYALTEFCTAVDNSEARSMADQLFQIVDSRAHDADHGGYHEFLARDWTHLNSNEPSYMGQPADVKQVNTHLHLMEAFTLYARMADSELVRNRLSELIHIQNSVVVVEQAGACTDLHSTNWVKQLDRTGARATYGHDLENVWMLIEANRALNVSNTPFVDLYEHLFLTAVRYGWDLSDGGFYYQGALLKSADRRTKIWWVQAEAMLCALHMYILTGRAMYVQILEKTLSWIDKNQIDWSGGEWYLELGKNGQLTGGKASETTGSWKTPYHSGRAVIHCLELLRNLR